MPDWPHSPVHRFDGAGVYMVTGATYRKQPLFRGPERLRYLCETLLKLADEHGWRLEAWAVFPNHYHFVAWLPERAEKAAASCRTPKSAAGELIRYFHSVTAIQVNRWDQTPGRRVWFQYWDTRLTFQKSYLARLSYVHKNAVHHGLVHEPSLYTWCSAGWFERRAKTSFYRTVMGMKIDHVQVGDDFSVAPADI